jgi:hypothetical protein
MTRSNLIFTHGAVFSVGIAAAMIVNSVRNSETGDTADSRGAAARSISSSAASRLEAGGANKTASRANRDARATSAAAKGGPAVERLAGIVRITDSFERQRALMGLIESLGAGEFAAVADQFRQLDHLGDSRGEYELLLNGWAKADPLGALAYVGEHGGRGRGTILSSWAGNDPAAAEQWARENHSGEGANPHMAAVIRGIAGQDLVAASRLAQEMPSSRERGEAIGAITRALFVAGIDAAMAYPASIQDEHLRGSFVSEIAQRLVGKDPVKAADWIASMDQGAVQSRAARQVGGALAQVDPKAAASWVSKLRPEAQSEAARGVIPIMSRDDIAGTAQWVSGLAGTPNYDRVVEEFVWSCNSRAPEQSAAWIQGVSNPDQQRRLYHRMLGEWAQRDAAAVRQWVASNEVPADVLRRFSR